MFIKKQLYVIILIEDCIFWEVYIMKKSVLKVMLGTIILESILVCVLILIGNAWSIGLKAISSIGIIFGYSIPCLLYSKVYESNQYRFIAIYGSFLAGLAAIWSILGIWEIELSNEYFDKVFVIINILVGALALIAWIISYFTQNKVLNIFKRITIVCILFLSIFLSYLSWIDTYPEGLLIRIYYVLIVLTVGSFISTLILTRIYRNDLLDLDNDNIANNMNME